MTQQHIVRTLFRTRATQNSPNGLFLLCETRAYVQKSVHNFLHHPYHTERAYLSAAGQTWFGIPITSEKLFLLLLRITHDLLRNSVGNLCIVTELHGVVRAPL